MSSPGGRWVSASLARDLQYMASSVSCITRAAASVADARVVASQAVAERQTSRTTVTVISAIPAQSIQNVG
ncbi:hypothetical protein GCM10027061_00830 [Nesterenkonia suensis]